MGGWARENGEVKMEGMNGQCGIGFEQRESKRRDWGRTVKEGLGTGVGHVRQGR